LVTFRKPAHWRENESLSNYTTWRIGGPARYISFPTHLAELQNDLIVAEMEGLALQILGGGSNLLFPDEGYGGLLIQLPRQRLAGTHTSAAQSSGNRLAFSAGASLTATARELSSLGLSGFEWAEGIPGTIGGAVVNNAGAYGGSISASLEQALVLEPDQTLAWWPKSQFNFAYRSSILKNRHPSQAILLAVEFALEPADPALLAKRMTEIKMERHVKLPTDPSCGCVFKNPKDGVAWRIIGAAGLAGERCGGCEVSKLHHNFILNIDRARAYDVLELIRRVRERIQTETGHHLELEVQLIGFPEEVRNEFGPSQTG
jgi:UDP-N-acetylmuramate dehydrogenase